MAAVHSTRRRHLTPAFRIARNSSCSAASSVGKLPRVLMILRKDRCSASTALVTGMRITVPTHPARAALVLAYGVTIRDEGHREHVSGQADLYDEL